MTSSPLPDSLSESDLDAAAAAAGQKILNSQSNDNSNNPLIPEQRPLDLMYSHPNGGNLFCGNQNAAASLELLQQNAITVIVNCQDVLSTNFFEGDERFSYHRFPIGFTGNASGIGFSENCISASRIRRPAQANAFFSPIVKIIDAHLSAKQSVLIHCAAGAHRAATCTAAYLLFKQVQPLSKLQHYMESRRYVVELECFRQLFETLQLFEQFLMQQRQQQAAVKANDEPPHCAATVFASPADTPHTPPKTWPVLIDPAKLSTLALDEALALLDTPASTTNDTKRNN